MKKRWEEPRILVQKFMPNEYVAACGDENKVYKFTCDAPTEWGSGLVYVESNGEPGLQVSLFGGEILLEVTIILVVKHMKHLLQMTSCKDIISMIWKVSLIQHKL